ncbi:LysR family transcriptional regulator [Dysosmobacter welbionis]|uniref:LysR family transcriptional regulator n=1 Tax=Dysosmobacter welbionis TaxID=2093857 RepID=UPI0031F661CF
MDLRQLGIFVTAYEKGSLSRAAECLNTSQPNVSKNIRALEEELGRPAAGAQRQGVQPPLAGRCWNMPR